MADRSLFQRGETVPWFKKPTSHNPQFQFSSLGGRFVLLTFPGSSQLPIGHEFVSKLAASTKLPSEKKLVAFAVSWLKADMNKTAWPEFFLESRIFHDPDFEIMKQYRVASDGEDGKIRFSGGWYILDPMLRVYESGHLHEIEKLIQTVAALPDPVDHASPGVEGWAPVLMVPRVLPPDFCRHLIETYQSGEKRSSGFMREENGKTVAIRDSNFKRRHDVHIEDQRTKEKLNRLIFRNLKPQIYKAFQFNATRIERYIVACYDENDRGFFKAHRDNTTAGTAHRRFAVTINLNAEDFDGGELRFPEFGTRTYKAPTGGAIVFGCSLLHEALPVTRGERYATLPFLYDDAAAKIRAANEKNIVGYATEEEPAT
ncbi:MAG: 2OG-Fe(II) oxygenase [Alphaproteobacteria bacterium]|nr:2OG-Fe(II) oxygenase [Alphaproteobacteria bacterium]